MNLATSIFLKRFSKTVFGAIAVIATAYVLTKLPFIYTIITVGVMLVGVYANTLWMHSKFEAERLKAEAEREANMKKLNPRRRPVY